MKNINETNSAKAARQSMLESAADSQQFASAECAASDTKLYQVNVHVDMDGNEDYSVASYSEDGFFGRTRGTTSSDGSYETTDWGVFVGTKEECEAYVAEHTQPSLLNG